MKHLFQFLFAPIMLGIDDPAGGGGGAGGGTGGAGGTGGNPPVIDYRTYIDDKGNFTKPDWAGEEKSLGEKFKTLPDLIKSYRTLERMNSGPKIPMPGENSTEAEWNEFFTKLGRPETPDKYEVAVPDELKGLTLDEEALKEFRSMAYKNGLNGKQVKALTDFYFKSTKGAIDTVTAQLTEAHEKAMADLTKEWGPADGAKFKENKAMAERGAAAVGLTAEVLQANPSLSNNPHFIRAMAQVSKMVAEGTAPNLRQQSTQTTGGVQEKIKAIQSNKEHPLWKKDHPDHKAAVKEMESLYQQLHGAA